MRGLPISRSSLIAVSCSIRAGLGRAIEDGTETCIHRAERIAQRLQHPAEASQVEIDHTALSDRHVDAVADGGLRASELVQVEVIG